MGGSRGRRGAFLAAVGAGLLALACLPAGAGAAGFEVGAAKLSVTPPPFDVSQDKLDFPTCFAGGYPGPWTGERQFRFEEPYVDVNNNHRFDYGDPAAKTPPEPYCDANANGRYDGIWLSSGTNQMAALKHDDIDVRAVAFSDGSKTVVVASVVSQGLFNAYTPDEKLGTKDMRARAQALRPGITDMFVSSNHNESSPDPIGIYGAPDFGGNLPAGANSGIDEYYMNWLDDRVAEAAATAYDRRQPATLWARQFLTPPNLYVEIHNFPTTADNVFQPRAIDPKIGVLQARDGSGAPIVTIMSLAAHNQEIGHSKLTDPATGFPLSREISSDWPGYFHRSLESRIGGMAMYLVGDNGSEEDPSTVPPVTAPECGPIKHSTDPPYAQRTDGCYPQAQATGEAFAGAVAAQAPRAERLRFGPLVSERHEFDVPLENNGFRALAEAGVFDNRPTYTSGQFAGRAGQDLRTEVGVLEVGPDLQLIANPGESFPALMLGSPWGIEDAECPNRPNPSVPTWQAHATYRFQMGLANDLIGYLIPAWAAFTAPELYGTVDGCTSSKHSHGLESEGVGPTASNAVANQLTALLRHRPDPAAHVVRGRFVMGDGSLSRRPEGAVGIWFAGGGSTSLTPGSGTVIATAGVTGFGSRAIDSSGKVMDYDGAPQDGGDVLSRGMLVYGCDGNVAQRFYLDVYPTLGGATRLGGPTRGDAGVGCGAGFGGGVSASCRDRGRPFSSLIRGRARVSRRFGLDLRGRARDRGCAGVGAVLISLSKLERHGCRYLLANGRLRRRTACRRSVWLRARGTSSWRLRVRARLPRGYYRLLVRAIDRRGNHERPSRANSRRVRL